MTKGTEVIHHPFGNHHPYESGADERKPRRPYAHESVEIGVLTRPIGAVKNISITFWTDDDRFEKETIAAEFIEFIADEIAISDEGHLSEAAARAGLVSGVDNWLGNLPAFTAGTKVFYQLVAETREAIIQSQIFEYTVRKVIALHEVVNVLQGQDFLVFILTNPVEKKSGYLSFNVAAEGHIQIKLGHGTFTSLDKLELIQPDQAGGTFFTKTLGATTLKVNLSNFHVQLSLQDNLGSTGIYTPQLILGDEETVRYGRLPFDSPQGEAFYGFGERFNKLNQRGLKLDVRVYEQYKNHGLRTYIPMPLFVSSQGYGLLVKNLRYSIFDLAYKDPNRWTLETEFGTDESITLNLVLGDPADLLDIISRLNALTCRPNLPPNWAFGLWMSGNEWNTQARVEEMVAKTEQHGIPASVIVVEAWSDEHTFYIWNDARYTPKPGKDRFGYADFDFPAEGMWPDPKGMVENLHKQGVHILLWQIPVLKKNDEIHAQLAIDKAFMLERGYCVRTTDENPYFVRPFWFREGLLMDFTNPQGVDWWMHKRDYLLDEIGIDGFKTDGGEHIWGRDLVFADGRKSDEVWNEYPNLYVGAYYQYAQKHNSNAITFSRAGFTGGQAFPCHWAGDENSTWEAFQRSILAGLNAGISGLAFWGWDLAGFSGKIPTAELYLRSTAMATFCPIMQYHSEYNHHRLPSNDRTPWNISERTDSPEVLTTFRFFTRLRMNLLPYILHTARQAADTGLPMMRALCVAYPRDKVASNYPFQYMFGDSLLVAPIVQPDINEVDIYLPGGEWYSFWDGQYYPGGSTYQLPTSLEQIPVFVRSNSLVPLNLDDTYLLGSDVGNQVNGWKNLTFKFFPGPSGSYHWYDDAMEEEIVFSWEEKSPNTFVFRIPPLTNQIKVMIPKGFTFEQTPIMNYAGEMILDLQVTEQDKYEILLYRSIGKIPRGQSGFLVEETS